MSFQPPPTFPIVWSDKDRGAGFLPMFKRMLAHLEECVEDTGQAVVGAEVVPLPERGAHVVKFLLEPKEKQS